MSHLVYDYSSENASAVAGSGLGWRCGSVRMRPADTRCCCQHVPVCVLAPDGADVVAGRGPQRQRGSGPRPERERSAAADRQADGGAPAVHVNGIRPAPLEIELFSSVIAVGY